MQKRGGICAFALIALVSTVSAGPPQCQLDQDFYYPQQYVAYKLSSTQTITLDGKLDDPAWQDVEFTKEFVDISTPTKPAQKTQIKVRYDDQFLYVGAMIYETQVWANITTCCHCNTTQQDQQDQIIFHGNDFEVFVDADGSTHNIKELEINAANADWNLLVNKPYEDNGYENSSRVFGDHGFDMTFPPNPLKSAVYTDGKLNDPSVPSTYWSVEIAFPLEKLAYKTRASVPPKQDDYWRINFSRVQWNVKVVNGKYELFPSCQSCAVPGSALPDNWVWSPMHTVDMHHPELWGLLQFSEASPGATPIKPYAQWPSRFAAHVLYYAQRSHFNAHGTYTTNILYLKQHASHPNVLDGLCTRVPIITINAAGTEFLAIIESYDASVRVPNVTVNQERLIQYDETPLPPETCKEAIDNHYPSQYVAYKMGPQEQKIVIDGKLDDPAWQNVAFSSNFVDISSKIVPAKNTQVKIRYDDQYLYVGAMLQEDQVWANITSTCHCNTPVSEQQKQVIFAGNDFEIFVDADGSTRNTKEMEINAANAYWDMLMNRPYENGGHENSSRLYGNSGFDMFFQPNALKSAVHTDGKLNDPLVPATYWSVEIAFPLEKLAYETAATIPPKQDDYWRINFNRVEWFAKNVNGKYELYPSCQSCAVPGTPVQDNWVWSKMYGIDTEHPEMWGLLQFSEALPGTTPVKPYSQWPARYVAHQLYYAQVSYATHHGGKYCSSLTELAGYATHPSVFNGQCTGTPMLTLNADKTQYTATIWPSMNDDYYVPTVTVDETRLIQTRYNPAPPESCAADIVNHYPSQYVAYKLGKHEKITIDGKLDDLAWQAVGFSSNFVDISTDRTPAKNTQVKIRYDNDYLYIGAMLQEDQVWANITSTCHCTTDPESQVIYNGNDFEVFVDADGSTRWTKEIEINAANADWNLMLSRPYENNGYENSSRIYGKNGFDMTFGPGVVMKTATYFDGKFNDPSAPATFWSVELAIPLTKLAYRTNATVPPRQDDYWRLNFNRVEWNVKVVNGKYELFPSCQSCAVPGAKTMDNWVWSPMGVVAMQHPEVWGFVQFSEAAVNTTTLLPNPQWPSRYVAHELYYAEKWYHQTHGKYTSSIAELKKYAKNPAVLNGKCLQTPTITLSADMNHYVAIIAPMPTVTGVPNITIDENRLILPVVARTPTTVETCSEDVNTHYPSQYVTYKMGAGEKQIVIDGKLDDPAWKAVGFSTKFVDISTATKPAKNTQVKFRYDNDYLYIGAMLQEPQVWANITSTCHCTKDPESQVIYNGNDFEVFVDADGSTQWTKEIEINAANATWDLMLNKPYENGGFENSSRIYGKQGFDMLYGGPTVMKSATATDGALNNPSVPATYWSVEIALPLSKLAFMTTATVPPRQDDFWRVNFNRVEWNVNVVLNKYQLAPSCQSCAVPGTPTPDNWVWSAMGAIAMQRPELWGFLQFSEGSINSTTPIMNPQWPQRYAAHVLYYAQIAVAKDNHGLYTKSLPLLQKYATHPAVLNGACTKPITIVLTPDAKSYVATIDSNVAGVAGITINQNRHVSNSAPTPGPAPGPKKGGTSAAVVILVLLVICVVVGVGAYLLKLRNKTARRAGLSAQEREIMGGGTFEAAREATETTKLN